MQPPKGKPWSAPQTPSSRPAPRACNSAHLTHPLMGAGDCYPQGILGGRILCLHTYMVPCGLAQLAGSLNSESAAWLVDPPPEVGAGHSSANMCQSTCAYIGRQAGRQAGRQEGRQAGMLLPSTCLAAQPRLGACIQLLMRQPPYRVWLRGATCCATSLSRACGPAPSGRR